MADPRSGRRAAANDEVTEEASRPDKSDCTSEECELGLWLASLGSLLVAQNHPAGGGPDEATGREYRCEVLVIREILLRCLHLTANLIGEASSAVRTDGDGSIGADSPVSVSHVPERAEVGELVRLAEGFREACAACDAALAPPAVGYVTWGHVGNTLLRVLNDTPAAGALAESARSAVAQRTLDRLSGLAEAVTPEELGEDIFHVFDGFSRLLGYLTFAERALSADAPLKSLLAVFALVRGEAGALLEEIERMSGGATISGALKDALDGTAYAVSMELKKNFEQELRGYCAAGPDQTYASAESACGLLRNCFQQSVVALAQSIDPTVQGQALFDSFRTRLDESLRLRSELWRLIRFVRGAEQSPAGGLVTVAAGRLKSFRDESLRHLMYKDREPFENFLEEVDSARGAEALADVLHRLHAFLETLFGQVNMRSALAEHPFDPDEAGPPEV